MVWTNLLTCSTALPFLLSKGWNFGGLYPLGYGLPRRRTSRCKSFNIAVIWATGSGSCLAFLCFEATFCSVRGTSPLYLEATSFSPMGSEAASGILAPLLLLGLGGMLCEWIISSLFFSQSPAKSPKCVSAFFLACKPKDPGPNSCSLVDWAWFIAANGAV